MTWQPDDEDRFHRQIHEHGRLIRLLALGLIAVSAGLICSNLDDVVRELGRIF